MVGAPDHLSPPSADVKYATIYTSALPYVFKAEYFIKLRDDYLLFHFS
jgi:hypothetical protein